MNLRAAKLIVFTVAVVTALASTIAVPHSAASPAARRVAASASCSAPQANVASTLLAVISSTPHPASAPIDYQAEVALFKRDLACAQRRGDLSAEEGNLGSLGVIEMNVGRYTDALAHEREALEINERLGNVDTEGYCHLEIGDVESALALYDDAIGEYEQAIALFKSELQPNAGAEALALNGIGAAKEREADPNSPSYTSELEGALEFVTRAEQLSGSLPQTLATRGLIESGLGDTLQARDAYEAMLDYMRERRDDVGEATALTDIARVDVQEKNYPAAVADALAAARLEAALGVPRWQTLALAADGDSMVPGREREAMGYYDRSIDDIERLRASISGLGNSAAFFGSALYVYDTYIAYLLRLDREYPGKGYAEKALEVFERRQGRAFLEEVGRSAATTFAGASSKLVDEERTLTANVAYLQNLIASGGPNLAAVETRAAQAASRLQSFEESLRTTAPRYYQLLHPQTLRVRCTGRCLSLATYQERLRPDEAVLVYGVTPRETGLWVIARKGEIRFFPIYVKEGVLAADLRAANPATCVAPGYSYGMLEATSLKLGRLDLEQIASADLSTCVSAEAALYRVLFPAGAAEATSRATTLFVVPSKELYGVPFEALVTRPVTPRAAPHYLIEDKAIAYLTSASLLYVLRTGVEQRHVAHVHPLVAFANPDYSDSSHAPYQELAALRTQALRPLEWGSFPPLTYSERYSKAAFASLGVAPSRASLFDGSRATLQMVERLNSSKALRSYRYILFGTHAVLPDKVNGISQPAIVLAHPETLDGYLTMGRVLGLSLGADAVILSACHTASSDDSVQGLTQAFMFAGTPVVAVTDWDVVAEEQGELIPALFNAMGRRSAPAQALRAAKLSMLRSRDVLESHPFFWAPMIIFGDGDSQ